MPFHTYCPACGHEYELDDSQRGKYVRCQHCPESFRAEPCAAPPAAGTRSSALTWKVGERVLAPWEPEFLYAGRVAKVEGGRVLIEFEDGDAGWVRPDQVRPLAVRPGQKVLSRRRMGPTFFPGEIREVRGDEVCVAFADGHADEWTRVAALRIPCPPTGPGAAPIQVASHRAFLERLQPGDRVWAPWQRTTLFVGTVDRIQDNEAHIHFDDGDQGWVLLDQLVPLEIPVGLRVMGRWKMGSQFYPGTVTEVQGDRVHVQYDDGDREWTRPAALALSCEPFGPDARPTRVARRWQPVLGWVVPVLIGIGLAFLRINCR
jgi:predicted Zn finger-like uncharacterized protein